MVQKMMIDAPSAASEEDDVEHIDLSGDNPQDMIDQINALIQ